MQDLVGELKVQRGPARNDGLSNLQRAQARALARKRQQIALARAKAGPFIEYALRNESDDSILHNADFHNEWHDHFDQNQFSVLISPVEHGKTQQIAVGRVLWRLGQDTNRRIALIQGTASMAEKTLRQIRTEIETNARIREVFPRLRPSPRKADPWTQSQITVDRDVVAKDPSIQARGVFGDVVGSRLTDIVLDDVLTFENTRTDTQRKKLIEWFDTTVFTRLLPNGVIWAIGTPWAKEDLLHELESRPGFASKRFSAVINPDDPPARWIPLWPEQWDLERLNQRRENMPEATFIRKYLCRVRLDETSRFREIWMERMCRLGVGRTFMAEAPVAHARGPRLPCFTGVDLGIGTNQEDAQTVLFTLALLPNGQRLVVDIEAGRWQAPEILDRLESAHRRFDSEVLVESNAGQRWITQMANGRFPVSSHQTTASNKWSEEFGVESLAVEMRNGLWVMPSGASGEAVHPEGRAFINECLHFDPEEHTGDRLMAGWIAREALRRFSAQRTRYLDTQSR